jgi:hypothetical protein
VSFAYNYKERVEGHVEAIQRREEGNDGLCKRTVSCEQHNDKINNIEV